MDRRPTDAGLLRVLDASWAEAARRAGSHLVCRHGCTACCVGPFPITSADALRLARGLALLRRADPARAGTVVARAREAIATFRRGVYPGDPRTGALSSDDTRVDPFLEAHADAACPALDPGSGGCDLYDARPISCRTFGPPVLVGGEALPPCALCFTEAAPEEVEAARVAFDPDDLEARVAPPGPETVVAFALVRGERAPRPRRRKTPVAGSRRTHGSDGPPRRSSD
jgi:Fe-S-cluster containining protein